MKEKSFVLALDMLPSVEEDLGQYSGLSTYEKYSTSYSISLVERCFSKAGSSASSGLTTLGLDVIDPRILNSPNFNRGNAHRSCVQAAIQPTSLTFPLGECKTTKMSVTGISQPISPIIGFPNQPVRYCAVTEATEKRRDLQEHLTTLSKRDLAANMDSNGGSHLFA
jgi:hypothetical protein